MSVARYVRPALRSKLLNGLPPRWLQIHSRKAYIEQAVLATPPWVRHKDILQIHKAAKVKSLETGVEHVLDHIVPLKHPYVCGLNVPWNLQIITRAQNAAKSNKWCPDQMEMFP